MKRYACSLIIVVLIFHSVLNAQEKSLVNTSNSAYSKLKSIKMGDVTWTKGFWADRFKVATETMVPNMWVIYNDPNISHAFKNFEIAAGLDTGIIHQHIQSSETINRLLDHLLNFGLIGDIDLQSQHFRAACFEFKSCIFELS